MGFCIPCPFQRLVAGIGGQVNDGHTGIVGNTRGGLDTIDISGDVDIHQDNVGPGGFELSQRLFAGNNRRRNLIAHRFQFAFEVERDNALILDQHHPGCLHAIRSTRRQKTLLLPPKPDIKAGRIGAVDGELTTDLHGEHRDQFQTQG